VKIMDIFKGFGADRWLRLGGHQGRALNCKNPARRRQVTILEFIFIR